MKTCLTLLPWEYRRRRLLERRIGQWSLAWGLSLGVALGLIWMKCRVADRDRWGVQALERKCAPLSKTQLLNDRLRSELEAMRARDIRLARLQRLRPPLTAIELVSQGASRCQDRIWVQRFVLQWDRQRGESKDPKVSTAEPAQRLGSLTVEGVALDNLTIAEFVGSLRGSDAFERVELRSSVTKESPEGQTRSYVVECGF